MACAHASTVVYDTIDGYSPTGGGQGLGYDSGLNNSNLVGTQFTATITGYISALETSINPGLSGMGPPTAYSLGVYSDSSGNVGSLLETLTVNTSAYPVLSSDTYSSGTTLLAGKAYWIVAGIGASVPAGGWFAESNGATVLETECTGSQSGNVGALPCSTISGDTTIPNGLKVTMDTVVPLPGALWLLVSGLGGLGLFRRKRLVA